MKHNVLLLFLLCLLLPSALSASTYVVLWANYEPGTWINREGSVIYPENKSHRYVDAFPNLDECKKAKQQRLEDEVWSQVGYEDGIRIRRQKMSQIEIDKYKKQHPYELDRVVTDGQIKRDSLGLVPIDPEFGRELKQRGAPDLPSGWVAKREWVRKPSYLEIQRNDGKRLVYEWICMPDTIDPRR
jgi:hypothetical protein